MTTPLKTLQEQWKEYRDACYPKGIPAIQNRECHQAFFAGALVVLKLAVERSSNLTEEEAFKQVGYLIREAQEVCSQRVYILKSQN